MADAWGSLAEAEHKRGRYPAALEALERQDRLAPGSPQVMFSFANLYLELGDLEKARLAAERALVVGAPPEAREVLARIALARRDYPTAEREATLALEGHRGRKLPYLVLAQVQKARGDLPGALRTLDDVLERLARSGQGELSNVHYLRGDILARMERDAEAEAEFRKELSMFPDSDAAWAGLALLYASQGRDGDVRRAIDGLLRAQPTRAVSHGGRDAAHPGRHRRRAGARTERARRRVITFRGAEASWRSRSRRFPFEGGSGVFFWRPCSCSHPWRRVTNRWRRSTRRARSRAWRCPSPSSDATASPCAG